MSKTNYSNQAFVKDTPEYFKRKANQHYEMAGLARQDNDMKDSERHIKLAKEFDEKANM